MKVFANKMRIVLMIIGFVALASSFLMPSLARAEGEECVCRWGVEGENVTDNIANETVAYDAGKDYNFYIGKLNNILETKTDSLNRTCPHEFYYSSPPSLPTVDDLAGDANVTIDSNASCVLNFRENTTFFNDNPVLGAQPTAGCLVDPIELDYFAECAVQFPSVPGSGSGSTGSYRDLPPVNLENPLGETKTVPELIGRIITVILGVLGTVALFVFVFGAFNWVTSAGYPQRVQEGVKTMLFAVFGLFIIFAAYGILSALFRVLQASGG
jgi:hypothetical protein